MDNNEIAPSTAPQVLTLERINEIYDDMCARFTEKYRWIPFARAVEAAMRDAPQAEPTISTEHGPWLPSRYHEDETYCQRCLMRDKFLGAKDCTPHIVYPTPSAPTAVEPRPCKVGGPCVATASSPCACRDLQRPQPPAQAASLTDDRILEIWFQSDAPSAEHDWRGGIVRFARALETHHGINKEAP